MSTSDSFRPGEPLPGDADLVILPGSKATRADLQAVLQSGWDIDLEGHLRRGGRVLGICGGYQMLGSRIADPDGIEGPAGSDPGLGLLPVETVLGGDKALIEVAGTDVESGEAVRGYEMHIGRTTGTPQPMLTLDGRAEGAVSDDGRVAGCYLHGLFAADRFRHAYLSRLRARAAGIDDFEGAIDGILDGLAAHLEAHLDLDGLLDLAQTWAPGSDRKQPTEAGS